MARLFVTFPYVFYAFWKPLFKHHSEDHTETDTFLYMSLIFPFFQLFISTPQDHADRDRDVERERESFVYVPFVFCAFFWHMSASSKTIKAQAILKSKDSISKIDCCWHKEETLTLWVNPCTETGRQQSWNLRSDCELFTTPNLQSTSGNFFLQEVDERVATIKAHRWKSGCTEFATP